jgi:hypothetical protein
VAGGIHCDQSNPSATGMVQTCASTRETNDFKVMRLHFAAMRAGTVQKICAAKEVPWCEH